MHDYLRWKLPVSYFKDLNDLLGVRQFSNGIYATELSPGHTFDFLIKRNPSKLGLVIFSAAVNRKEIPKPPVLFGQSMAAAVNATLISISEIALTYDPALEIGWHAGTYNIPMQKIMPQILDHLRQCMGIEKLVLFGGSAGGFAALYYGSVMDNVFPIAANPQTQISSYYPQAVSSYARHCWQWNEIENIDDFLNERIVQRLGPAYSVHKKPFLYVQNLGDNHVQKHALPFMKDLNGLETPVSGPVGSGYISFRQWGEGHVSPPKDEITQVLKNAFAWDGPWNEYISEMQSNNT